MSSRPTSIRLAQASDLDLLVDGNLAIAAETEGLRLDRAVVARGVRAVIAEPAKGFYLVAERGGAPAGQLLVTFEWSDWRAAWWYWIQSVYVRPEARRRGIYRALHAAVLDLAQSAAEPVAGVKLYVDRDNLTAQATYMTLGMGHSHYQLWEQALPVLAATPAAPLSSDAS